MNNLASLKSELLYEYSQEEHRRWLNNNFYLHHHLPSRTMPRTKQNKHVASAPKLPLNPLSTRIVGRKLFEDSSKQLLPGPGSYDTPLRKQSSHCYIKKEENHVLSKVAKRLRRRSIINECRGPGIYNPETAFEVTSKGKNHQQGSFAHSPVKRMLLSQQQLEKMYLIEPAGDKKQQKDIKSKAGSLKSSLLLQTTSNFSKSISHKMSSTQRSSLVNQNMVPGPGFYRCESSSLRVGKSTKAKGRIQFKFVYGHAS